MNTYNREVILIKLGKDSLIYDDESTVTLSYFSYKQLLKYVERLENKVIELLETE